MFYFILAWVLLFLLLPTFFVLKAKNRLLLKEWLMVSGVIGYLSYLGLIIITSSSYKGLYRSSTKIVEHGVITSDGYFLFFRESLVGACLAALIGAVWWFILIRNKS